MFFKESCTNIKFFKSLCKPFVSLIIIILVFSNFGFSFRQNEPVGFLNDTKRKIKIKVNYTENPNKDDFFTQIETRKYIELGLLRNLDGIWRGVYSLDKDSVFWINPNLDSLKIFNLIKFGPYDISIKFNFNNEKFSSLEIAQEDLQYGPVNVDMQGKKQINYWTKASFKNWLEIVRGKIFKVSDSELFTIFQTTVYEDKIPIYAFYGESILKR